MQLKAGDRIYCKKSWSNCILMDETYKVDTIILDSKNKVVGVVVLGAYFYFIVNSEFDTRLSFKVYFYTEKEIRKLKLDAIESR